MGGMVEELVNTVFGPMSVLKNDIRIGQELRDRGCWDLREILDSIHFFERFAPVNHDIILDIGCNMGAWTLPVCNRFPDHTIHAFDCQEPLINCLDRTINLNKLEKVKTYLVAVSDVDGEIEFPSLNYNWGSNFGAFELEPVIRNSDFNGVTLPGKYTKIPSRTIDSFEFDNVGLIKIDVEGMELKVLKGAVKTLQKCKSVVLFENHKTDYNEVVTLLNHINYQIINTVGQMSCAVFNK
jgi:FkbM family methyltransferase